MSVPATRDANSTASYTPTATSKPVKKASYERSKNAWCTCDLPMPQGTTRTQPASPSFLCLPPSSPLFPLPRPQASERFLASRSRPTAPLYGPADQSCTDLWVDRTLQMDIFLLLSGASFLAIVPFVDAPPGKKIAAGHWMMTCIISCKMKPV